MRVDARDALQGLIAGRTIECEQRGRDRYGRMVAVCRAAGQDLSEVLARAGMATAMPKYSHAYVGAEATARSQRAGLWATQFEQPSAFRGRKRASLSMALPRARDARLPRMLPVLIAGADPAITSFRSCREASSAGAVPLRRGQAGYRIALDRDRDGLACEP